MMQKRGFLWSLRECISAPAVLSTGNVSHLPISEQLGFYLAKLIFTPRRIKNRLIYRYAATCAYTVNRVPQPPHLGKLIICLFVSPEKQVDRLADFEELFTVVWLPSFGARIARLIYVAHAIRSAGAIVRIGVITAIADGIVRALGR